MSKSLRDQLNLAGLTTKQQVKQAKSKIKKEKKLAKKTNTLTEQQKQSLKIEKKKKQQSERDKQLNQKLEEQKNQKSLLAQIKQLIESHKLAETEGDIGYNFIVKQKVKKIYVDQKTQEMLSRGLYAIGIIINNNSIEYYHIIPSPIADKIKERAPEYVSINNTEHNNMTKEEEDWYKDFEIPDDLIW